MTATPRTLFVAAGRSPSAWYRCALPAEALGLDWIGVRAQDDRLGQVSGGFGVELAFDDWLGYEIVVLQQPLGRAWRARIAALKAAGVCVLYETDSEPHAAGASRKALKADAEQTMRACDGVICATDWLARSVRGAARRTWVCRNGLDLIRFDVSRAARADVHIGWAGGEGSENALLPWLQSIQQVLLERPQTRFVSVGTTYGDWMAARIGADRCMAIPYAALETYPAAMTLLDIALAPSDGSRSFSARSDLRFLEAAAVGAAVVGDPRTYGTIENGVTGLHASTPTEARERVRALVDDAALRVRLGASAREYVRRERGIRSMSAAWADALRAAVPAAVV